MIKHTFQEWRSIGFGVLKGEHSSERNAEGTPLFTELQVKILEMPRLGRPLFTSNEERGFPPED